MYPLMYIMNKNVPSTEIRQEWVIEITHELIECVSVMRRFGLILDCRPFAQYFQILQIPYCVYSFWLMTWFHWIYVWYNALCEACIFQHYMQKLKSQIDIKLPEEKTNIKLIYLLWLHLMWYSCHQNMF